MEWVVVIFKFLIACALVKMVFAAIPWHSVVPPAHLPSGALVKMVFAAIPFLAALLSTLLSST